MKTQKRLTQTGFIMFGNGLNKRAALDAVRKEGAVVRVKKGHAEIWRVKV